MLGTLAGTLMPWVDQSRLVAFTLWPYVLSFGAIVAPSLFVFCAFTFSVAASSRSSLLAFVVAPASVVFALVVNNQASTEGVAPWWPLLDPFAVLPVEAAVRYWSVADLNGRVPIDFIAANRALWLTLASIVLAYSLPPRAFGTGTGVTVETGAPRSASVPAQSSRPASDYHRPTPPITATAAYLPDGPACAVVVAVASGCSLGLPESSQCSRRTPSVLRHDRRGPEPQGRAV